MLPLPTYALTDCALEANASVLAAGVLSHPIGLQLTPAAVVVLANMANAIPLTTSDERQFLREALALVDAAEILAGREATR